MSVCSRLPRGDVIVGLSALACLIAILLLANNGLVSNDGAQYLSTIEQLRAGNGLATSTIYYDLHADLGMPAAQTVWPPGLVLVVAFVMSVTGLTDIMAMALTNALAHCATTLVIYRLAQQLLDDAAGFGPALIALCYLTYSVAVSYTLSAQSEPLFTLCLVASIWALHRALADPPGSVAWFGLVSLMVGLSILFRYLGLAFVPALALVGLIGLLQDRCSRASTVRAAALVLPAVSVFVVLSARNYALTGRLSGGPTGPRALELSEILFQSKWALIGMLGGGATIYAKLAMVLFVAGVAGVVLPKLVRIRWRGLVVQWRAASLIAFAVTGTATTLGLVLFMATRNTGVAVEGRYFVPCVPVLLIALLALHRLDRDRPVHARATLWFEGRAAQLVAAGAIALSLANLAGLAGSLRAESGGAAIERLLAVRIEGRTAKQILVDSASLRSPVMSNQSQALYAVLRRPTIGVPERRLTAVAHSAKDVLARANRFGARYLVVFPRMPLGAEDGSEDYVLKAVASGTLGLPVLHSSAEIIILELPSTLAGGAGAR